MARTAVEARIARLTFGPFSKYKPTFCLTGRKLVRDSDGSIENSPNIGNSVLSVVALNDGQLKLFQIMYLSM
jgi:hypothetical protein